LGKNEDVFDISISIPLTAVAREGISIADKVHSLNGMLIISDILIWIQKILRGYAANFLRKSRRMSFQLPLKNGQLWPILPKSH
jgi:hypothetical protein